MIVAVCLVMFAFTSLLGSGFYGQRGVESLNGGRCAGLLYGLIYLIAILLGSMGELSAVWQFTDLCNGLLALPNLIALLLLSPEGLKLIRGWNEENSGRKRVCQKK